MAHIVMAYGEWPYTTAEYLGRAFKSLGHEVTVLPLQKFARGKLNRVLGYYKRSSSHVSFVDAAKWIRRRRIKADLFLWVESPRFVDVALRKPFACPTAAWVIDTNVAAARLQALSAPYDHAFVSQKEGTERFVSAGLNATWLPLAADPEFHRPFDEPIVYDLGFVGRIESKSYQDRFEMLRALSQKYKVLVTTAYGTEMAKVYSRCTLAFNRGLNRGFNMRVFEAMAIGRPLVTDLEASGLRDVFIEGRHFAGYSDQQTLEAKIDDLLAQPERASAMAAAARDEVLGHHTYVHRARKILEKTIGAGT